MLVRPFRILIGESSHFHAVLISRQLNGRFEDAAIDLFTDAKQLIKAIQSEAYDIAIFDPTMDGSQGLPLISRIQEIDDSLPMVLVLPRAAEQQLPRDLADLAAASLVKENLYFQTLPSLVCDVIRKRFLIERSANTEERGSEQKQKQFVRIAASTLSHEVNNPLQTILGTVELLMESSLVTNPEIAAKVRVIQESAVRIQRTLHRLANLATPAINETASGEMIDPERSRIYTLRPHSAVAEAE